MGDPVPGNLLACRHPGIAAIGNMLEDAFQSANARWPGNHAQVQANRQHAWQTLAFATQPVETVAHVGCKRRL